MYGAIIGDLAGSIYEFEQTKKVSKVICNNIIEKNSFISDDTILTISILDAILTDKNYNLKLREYIDKYKEYKPNFTPYFEKPFSPALMKWSKQNEQGKSIGNGAMMRISPIGHLFDTEKEVIENAKLATIPSHNTEEAIQCATIIALVIFYARKGYSKDEILSRLNLRLTNKQILKFNYTCYDTIDICLYAVFTSNSFEESIRKVLLYGGDTDTNACIVGSMAEALYGIDNSLIIEADKHLPKEFKEKLDLVYNKKC